MQELNLMLDALPEEHELRKRGSEVEIEISAMTQMETDLQARVASGKNIGTGASLMKNMASSLGQQLATIRLEAIAYYGLPHNNQLWLDGEEGVGDERYHTAIGTYLNTRASSIFGGSKEVQKNIIAKTVLGL